MSPLLRVLGWAAASAALAALARGVRLARGKGKKEKPRGGSKQYPKVRSESPDAAWTPGTSQPGPFKKPHQAIDPDDYASVYQLVISSYVPRPVAFVSSISASGEVNLAPYSYSGILGHDPPMIAIGCCRNARSKESKDTAKNILETREFVVHIISDWMLESANFTCGPFPHGVSEADVAGFTQQPSTKVGPPRMAEAAVQFECRLEHVVEPENAAGEKNTTIVLGRIVMFHVREELLVPGAGEGAVPTVNIAGYRPISRLGGHLYGFVDSVVDIPRVTTAQVQEVLGKPPAQA